MSTTAGTRYVVATRIGNLQDLTPRALEVLRPVGLISAQDTRHSGRVRRHLGVTTATTACHDHNERDKSARLVERLLAAEDMALISDAGTPLISDPGFHLVRQAREAGVRVSPIPGACALIA